VDNLDLGPHTAVPFRLVTVDGPFSCAEHPHTCPPFHYSDTGNKVAVLQVLESANCPIIVEVLQGSRIEFTKLKENMAQEPEQAEHYVVLGNFEFN
jgi:hypothetical protein